MYVIHLGFSAFPIEGYAPVQRVKLTFKGLKLEGFYTLIINKLNISSNQYHKKLNRHDGIPFIFTSLLTYRHNSFIVRNINKFTGYIGEFILLLKKRKKIHTAILYTSSFGQLIYYRIISRLLNFNLIIQYVELRSSLSAGTTYMGRLNDLYYDKYFFKFCDGVIAISDFLMNHVLSKTKKLPVIKLPAICDFNEFNAIEPFKSDPFLMYCGNIWYCEVAEFIIDVYSSMKKNKQYDGLLVLVISGEYEVNWTRLRAKIERLELGNQIVIKSHIPYNELLSLYKAAEVLMIPLRNTLQDNARFPHKIGEYTASKRPILSTNLGEVKIYFKDGVSAILADDYSVNSYIEKLSNFLSSKSTLDHIGNEGFNIGMNNFDYHAQAQSLNKFITNL